MRDFYDVYMLRELDEGLKPSNLRAALDATIEKRGSGVSASSYAQTLAEIEGSTTMAERWRSYGLSNSYASSIAWTDAVGSDSPPVRRVLAGCARPPKGADQIHCDKLSQWSDRAAFFHQIGR